MDPLELFDHLVIFRGEQIIADGCSTSIKGILDSIVEQLSVALGDRATYVVKIDLPIGQKFLPAIGIRVCGQSASSVITIGPQSGSEAGEDFRKFWSNMSQLRRIDGDLYECIVWSESENVCKQIVDFVLESRFKLSRGSFADRAWNQITSDRLDAILSFNPTLAVPATSVATSLRLIRAMDKLRGLLRGLNDKLPLDVTGVLPISSAFRDTAVFPPVISIPSTPGRQRGTGQKSFTQQNNPRTPIFPLYVVVTLEQSGKWPNELEAFLHMKRLMVIRIHELLSPLGIPSHVTVDNMLDIFLDGLIFRISIAQPRELRLLQSIPVSLHSNDDEPPKLKRRVSTVSASEAPAVDTPASLAWTRLNQSMPTICGMLAAVARSESHVFPTACRLAKRWLSAHGYPVVLCPFQAEVDGVQDLERAVFEASSRWDENDLVHRSHHASSFGPNTADCTNRLTEIAVELLVLYAAGFSDQHGTVSDAVGTESVRVASGSPVAAFLRFLRLLAIHDWEQRPLLIDLNEGFSDVEKRRTALACFDAGRERLPAMVLCTPLDPSGSEWTTVGPTRAGLQVLQQLAAQSRKLLRAMLVAGAKFRELKSVFCPAQRKTDVLLTLKPEIIEARSAESIIYDLGQTHFPGNMQIKTTKPCVWSSEAENALPSEVPPPGARYWPAGYCYDPLHWFVRLIQIHFGRYCEIRWDRHGGDWIALRWRHIVLDTNDTHSSRIFVRPLLDGLVTHKPSSNGAHMTVVHKLNRLLRVLPGWVSEFVEHVQNEPMAEDCRSQSKREVNLKPN